MNPLPLPLLLPGKTTKSPSEVAVVVQAAPAAENDIVTQLCVFGSDKAGMQGIDRASINKLILEASKDSAHFRNQQRKDESVQERIKALHDSIRERQKTWSQDDEEHVKLQWTALQLLKEHPAHVGVPATFVHVDMDMFYAAVEIRDQPHLANLPVAVGDPASVVATSNYVARRFGVRAAMPGFIARRLCPELVFVPSHRSKYRRAAEQTRAIFGDYDPEFRAPSLDEAQLNITAYLQNHPQSSGPDVAREIRRRIYEATGGLTASAGISGNAVLAKIASDHRKPNDQFEVPREQSAILAFVHPLSIRKVPGIGRVMEKQLNALGIYVCGDISTHRTIIAQAFGERTSTWLFRVALGLLSRRSSMIMPANCEDGEEKEEVVVAPITPSSQQLLPTQQHQHQQPQLPRKSHSVAHTFGSVPAIRIEELSRRCAESCLELATDVQRAGAEGRCVTVNLKLSNFHALSRSVTLNQYIWHAEHIIYVCLHILQRELHNLQDASHAEFQASHTSSSPVTPAAAPYKDKLSPNSDGNNHEMGKEQRKEEEEEEEASQQPLKRRRTTPETAQNYKPEESLENVDQYNAHRQIRLIGVRLGSLRPMSNDSLPADASIRMPRQWTGALAIEKAQRYTRMRRQTAPTKSKLKPQLPHKMGGVTAAFMKSTVGGTRSIVSYFQPVHRETGRINRQIE